MRCLAPFFAVAVFAVAFAAPATSYRIDYSTFREQTGGLSVFAGGYPASVGGDSAFVPVPVAIALMRNGKSVAFTPESFTLADAEGNRVPAAGYVELKNGYPRLAFERSLMWTWPINVGMTIAERPRIPSNFYPPTGGGTRIPRVELAPFSWFQDVVYFPRPPAGLGGVMTLTVAVGDGDPVEVSFFMDPAGLAR